MQPMRLNFWRQEWRLWHSSVRRAVNRTLSLCIWSKRRLAMIIDRTILMLSLWRRSPQCITSWVRKVLLIYNPHWRRRAYPQARCPSIVGFMKLIVSMFWGLSRLSPTTSYGRTSSTGRGTCDTEFSVRSDLRWAKACSLATQVGFYLIHTLKLSSSYPQSFPC